MVKRKKLKFRVKHEIAEYIRGRAKYHRALVTDLELTKEINDRWNLEVNPDFVRTLRRQMEIKAKRSNGVDPDRYAECFRKFSDLDARVKRLEEINGVKA